MIGECLPDAAVPEDRMMRISVVMTSSAWALTARPIQSGEVLVVATGDHGEKPEFITQIRKHQNDAASRGLAVCWRRRRRGERPATNGET